jgi:TonB family protein
MGTVAIAISLFSCFASGAEAGWTAVKIHSSAYPRLALQARMSGSVRLRIKLTPSGTVDNIAVISGQKLLAQAAQQNLLSWVFSKTQGPGPSTTPSDELDFTYEFKLRDGSSEDSNTEFSFEQPNHAVITASAPPWQP